MNNINFSNKKGFSIVEMITVIAIIGFLATIGSIAYVKAKTKARDMRRVSDISHLQNALSAYYRDNGSYPETETVNTGEALASDSDSFAYMARVPSNPEPWTDGDCSNNNYIYQQDGEGVSYSISFCLGEQSGSLLAGEHTAVPNGIY